MDLNISVCLKSFRTAFQQHRSNQTEQAIKDLERELDLLTAIASQSHGIENTLEGFSSKTLLHADSLSILVNILNDATLKANVHIKAIIFLSCLVENDKIRQFLQDSFQLTPTLVNFLMRQSATSDEAITFHGLQLLQQITYKLKIKQLLGEEENLIRYLVSKIISAESSFTLPCLGSLANICRSNANLQDYIKAMGNVIGFFRRLTEFLCHKDSMKIVYSLSILIIFVNEPIGEKVFNKRNMNQMFHMVFSFILKGNSEQEKKHSCNLLIDFIKCHQLQEYLAGYNDLHCYLKKVISLLNTSDRESTEKILELFIKLSEVECLKHVAMKAIFSNDTTSANEKNFINSSTLSTIMNILEHKEENYHSKSIPLSLKLIRNLYEIALSNDDMPRGACLTNLKVLLPVLANFLLVTDEAERDKEDENMANLQSVLDILIFFCKEADTLQAVFEYVDILSLTNMVSRIYETFGSTSDQKIQSNDNKFVISSVVVYALKLVLLFEENSHVVTSVQMKTSSSLLQSNSLPAFLVACLSSNSTDTIRYSFEIISKGRELQQFCFQRVCELVASNNTTDTDGLFSRLSSRSFEESLDDEIRHLNMNIEKIRINEEERKSFSDDLSQQINSQVDTKEATKIQELVDLFEYKLAAIETENKCLQELLVSKSDVAMQAEKLLAQSRCKNAQLEAECMKLRAVLVDDEKKIKEYKKQIVLDLKEVKALNAEINSLIKDKESLESKTQDYEHMQMLFEEETAKLREVQHNYSSIEEQKANLSEINTTLKKYNEHLKAQYDCSAQKLNEMEDKIQNTAAKLREEDQKNQELMKESQKVRQEKLDMELKLKEHFEALSKEREEVNEKLNALKNEVERLTKIAKEHEELKLLYADEENRLERMQRNFELVTTENKTLVEMENMCRKQNEDLKNKCDGVLQQYNKSEKEKKSIIMKVKEHEKTMEASTRLISELQEEIKLQEKKKSELELKVKKSEKKLTAAENAKSEMNHTLSSLKLLNTKYEKDLKEKSDALEYLKAQLEKHAQIQAMIHNLSK